MLRVFRNFTKTEWLFTGAIIAFVLVQVWFELTIPDYMAEVTTLVQTSGSAMESILIAGGKMLLCACGSLIASIIVAVLSAKIAANFAANLRTKLFDKVQSFSMGEIGKFSISSLITRSTNDVIQVQTLVVMGAQALIKAPITAIWAICKISGKNWQWTLTTAISVVLLILIVGVCIILSLPKFKSFQRLTDDTNRITREHLTGIKVVHAYNAERYQEDKFEKTNKEMTDAHLYATRVMSFLMPGIQGINNGLMLAIYWVGAVLIQSSALQNRITLFSDMVIFSSYAMQIIMSFMLLIIICVLLPRAVISAKRISEVLTVNASIMDGSLSNNTNNVKGKVEFRNVSFRYPNADDYILHNISFTANKGETVAIIGSTGCGKSTVINLIPRFYDATDGEVLIDDVNVKDYTQKLLHSKIGYVSQKAFLFSGDIRYNIAFGDNEGKVVTDESIKNAIQTAQADDFINNTEDGYSSFIAQNGTNLSGGQKQRVSIARAVYREPEIFIFDDSFSALDYETDKKLRKALHENCKSATKIIVAQRIGTIKNADKIVVLEDGKTAGIGTHNELLKNCSVYQQIAYSQLSKEELDR